MGLKEKFRNSVQRTKVKFQHPTLAATRGLESLTDFVTPIASVLTIGADPSFSLPEKILYGPIQTGEGIYKSIAAYSSNMGIRDFVNGAMGNLFHTIGNAANNIYEKPGETAAAIAATYVLGKAITKTMKLVRESREDNYLEKLSRD